MLAKILNLPSIKTDGEVDGELTGCLQKKKKFLSSLLKQFLDICVTTVSYDHVIQMRPYFVIQFLLNYRRSEEHTSELQSPCNLVCRLLLEKKKNSIILLCICLEVFGFLFGRSPAVGAPVIPTAVAIALSTW